MFAEVLCGLYHKAIATSKDSVYVVLEERVI
jgi:hypothetical protein